MTTAPTRPPAALARLARIAGTSPAHRFQLADLPAIRPPAAAGPGELRPPRDPGDARPRVGFLGETFVQTGGIETWHRTLYRTHRADLVDLVGYAAEHVYTPDPILPGGQRVEAGTESLRALARSVDIVVAWGIRDLARYLPERGDPRRPRVLAVSHGEARCDYTRRWLEDCAGEVDRFAAVSIPCIEAIPADRRGAAVAIANAYDPEKIRATRPRDEVRAELGLEPGAFLVLYNARLAPDKGLDLVLEGIRHAPARAVLAVAGTGHLETLATAAAAADPGRYRILGHREDTGDLLAAADLVVNPSIVEGFGLTMLEALAAGRPVAASPRGIAEDHPNWFRLVAADAGPRGWAAAIAAAMEDPAGEARRAELARWDARGTYGPDRFGLEWSRLILEAATPAALAPGPGNGLSGEDLERINGCEARGCRTGCGFAWCARHQIEAHLNECLACLEGTPPTRPGAVRVKAAG